MSSEAQEKKINERNSEIRRIRIIASRAASMIRWCIKEAEKGETKLEASKLNPLKSADSILTGARFEIQDDWIPAAKKNQIE